MGKSPEVKGFQSMLPGFEAVSVVPVERKPAQPRLRDDHQSFSRHEILYGRLDRHGQGRARRWLEKEIDFPWEEVLTPGEIKLVKRAFQPEEGQWLTEQETALQTAHTAKQTGAVRIGLKVSLFKLWQRKVNGPTSIETLDLPSFMLPNLRRLRIQTIEDILAVKDEEQLRRMTGGEFGRDKLKEALAEKGFEWKQADEVTYPLFPYRE